MEFFPKLWPRKLSKIVKIQLMSIRKTVNQTLNPHMIRQSSSFSRISNTSPRDPCQRSQIFLMKPRTSSVITLSSELSSKSRDASLYYVSGSLLRQHQYVLRTGKQVGTTLLRQDQYALSTGQQIDTNLQSTGLNKEKKKNFQSEIWTEHKDETSRQQTKLPDIKIAT